MSKIVQLVGHIAAAARQFIGAERELTVDTESNNLRIHDGSTPGGHIIPNLEQLGAVFQPQSDALSYLAGLGNENKGIAVRISQNSWQFRKVVGTDGQVTVTNGTGIGGNIQVALPDAIDKSLTFKQGITFEQAITATGGINGNVNGNLTGDFEGNLTGDVTGNLHGDSFGAHKGPVDVRGAALLLDDESIPLEKLAGLAEALAALIEPVGTIKLWNGTIETIPDGWHLCDGSNGTPNFTNKFLMGVNTNANHGATGGASTHTHAVTINSAGAHTHDITVNGTALTEAQIPSHKHGNGVTDAGSAMFNHGTLAANPTTADSIDNNSAPGTVEGYTTSTGGGAAHSHTASSASNGSHTHSNDVATSSNLPPYVGVLFIMKI